jgi:hypothetical protein
MLILKIEMMTGSIDNPDRAELENAVRSWIDECVWRREVRRAETGGLDFFDSREIEQMSRTEAVEAARALKPRSERRLDA